MYEENYRLSRIERFEAETVKRYPESKRVELHTIQIELSSNGLKFDQWSERGVVTSKQYLLPSAHLKLSDILVPRNKLKSKGVRYSAQVMFFEGDETLAQEVAIESIQMEIDKDIEQLNRLSDKLSNQRMM